MRPVRIRRGTPSDAEFLAWVMLAASRGNLARGMWDLIIGTDELGCLEYLKRLAVAQPRSLYHCETFLIAEVDAEPAAALSASDARDVWSIAGQAMASVERDLGWTEADAAASYERMAPIWANCMPPDVGADFIIENVATRQEYRRRGLVQALIEQALEAARQQGCRLAQISTYMGNDAGIAVYEKSGFRVLDEKRCADVQALLGVPGFVRLARELAS